jgi:glycosyltransferase involved in cell wall biosynthesis
MSTELPRDPTPRRGVSCLAVQAWARQEAQPGLVSIVIPVFNGAQLLHHALESVRAQEYLRWEAVVIDDGSTDASRAIAEEVAAQEPRLRVIAQTRGGHSAARNRGLVECRGEFLQFLDADDRLCAGKLESQRAYLAQHPHVDIVTGEAHYFDETGRLPALELAPPASYLIPDVLLRNVMCVDSPLVRRRVFARIGGFRGRTARGQQLYGCEDWDLWLRALLGGCELAYVPEVVVHNYWHASNLQRDRARMLESALWVLMDNAGAVSFRHKPCWGVSVLEKRLALWVDRSLHGTRAKSLLTKLWGELCGMRQSWVR